MGKKDTFGLAGQQKTQCCINASTECRGADVDVITSIAAQQEHLVQNNVFQSFIFIKQ